MLSLFADERLRTRYWWPVVVVLAVFVYLYALGSLSIPNIGDEAPYFQITRLTAESGEWLPLKAAEGLENTKPPMLFWQGIVSSDWGAHWSTWRLRIPVVIYTFLTAFLVFSLARHISGTTETGYIAALAFLGFSSTFQHGRPFLTNMPETFFMFLVFYLLLRFRSTELQWQFWIVAGLLMGAASLYRSFAVIAPMGLALGWYCWWRRHWNLADTVRRDFWKPTTAVVVGLLCFAIWPLLDPEPELIFQKFFLKENVGKFGGGNYFQNLVIGNYTAFRVWFGPVTNAGLLAIPLLYLAVVSIQKRSVIMNDEKALWILVFSYLLIFTLPTQRQENYVLPIMPALAILLAMQWNRIDRRWFILFLLPLVLAATLFAFLMFAIASDGVGGIQYALWHPMVLLLVLVSLGVSLFFLDVARFLFPASVFLLYLSFGALLSPFDGSIGQYSEGTANKLSNKPVYVPSNFRAKYEQHRFVLPDSDIMGYNENDVDRRKELIDLGEIVAIRLPVDSAIPENYVIYGQRLVVRSRLRGEELYKILFQQRTDVMLRREVIVQLKALG
jgi:4-amino-4-deoxy-L-arabinose transferase-like glycosyltransferase